ncbi:MAG: glutamate--tRNA ligase, partial [Anaerolineales bacterium]
DPAVPALLVTLAQRIESGDGWNRQAAEEAVRRLAEEQGVHSRELIHPVRVALSGKTAGPGLFALMEVLGRERVVARLRAAATRVV